MEQKSSILCDSQEHNSFLHGWSYKLVEFSFNKAHLKASNEIYFFNDENLFFSSFIFSIVWVFMGKWREPFESQQEV